MKFSLIIFDWDGTLMDSIDKIVLCMQAASLQEEQPEPSVENIRNIIGLSLQTAMARLFPNLSESKRALIVEAYRYQYTQHQHVNTLMYDGIVELLTSLKEQGYTLAVATGKGREGLNQMLQTSNTSHLFSATVCADEANSKPDPLMISMLLSELKVDPENAIMVGDSSYDLDMARNAGIKSIGVSYGVHSTATLASSDPISIVDSLPRELSQYI